jgi:recombination protein RecR
MAKLPKSITDLIESFERLPGIGPKSAARLAFYLLNVPQEDLDRFSNSLLNLKKATIICSQCYNISESDPCLYCTDSKRNKEMICVVERPIDVIAIESAGNYEGIYHVLGGAIDPLNNIGPEEIRVYELIARVKKEKVVEIILATNPSMEGEATAMYIKNELGKVTGSLSNSVKTTRLAHGLPVGADVEFADAITLSRALDGRREF